MNPELLGFCGDTLRDLATGINRLAIDLPGLAEPLPTCRVVTAMDEAWAARAPLPPDALADGPVCLVRQADDVLTGATAQDALATPEQPVLVAVAMRSSETHTGLYQVAQLLRCALRSLVQPFLAAQSVTRNQVEIEKPTQVLFPLITPSAEDTVLLAAAIIRFPVYDPWAIGAHVVTP